MVGDRAEVFSAPHQYVRPSELDLIARLAGLRRRERWATWGRDPFTCDGPRTFSVWKKPADDDASAARTPS